MYECHTFGKCVFDLKINLGHSDLYFMDQWFFFFYFFAMKNILVLLAKLNLGELRCPATALISFETWTYTEKSTKQVHIIQ